MPVPMIVPLGLVAGGLYLLSRDKKVGAQPIFTPPQKATLTETRKLPDGSTARYFTPEIANAIMNQLATKALSPVQVQGTSPGLIMKVEPMSGIAISAQAAAQAANSQNMVVMGTLSLALMDQPVDKLLLFVSPSQRTLANDQSQFAILLDAGAAASPAIPGTPAASPFDPGMDPALVAQVNAILNDPKVEPEALELMANDLEASGYPIAAKVLRDRAAKIRLSRSLADKQAGGTPFTIRGNQDMSLAVDLPYNTAQHYTGDGMRWREIASVNPGMTIKTVQGQSNLYPWKPGQTILLPLSWDVRSKPLPKTLGIPNKKMIYWNYGQQKWVDAQGKVLSNQPPPPASNGPITQAVAGISEGEPV